MADEDAPDEASDGPKSPSAQEPVGLTVGHAIAARSVLAAMERLMADPANAERVAGSLHGLGAEGSNTYLPSTGRHPASEPVVDADSARAFVHLVRVRLNDAPTFFEMFEQPR